MKKLVELYESYFKQQEILHDIQHDKNTWAEHQIGSYQEMVDNVNILNVSVRITAKEIKKLESKIN